MRDSCTVDGHVEPCAMGAFPCGVAAGAARPLVRILVVGVLATTGLLSPAASASAQASSTSAQGSAASAQARQASVQARSAWLEGAPDRPLRKGTTPQPLSLAQAVVMALEVHPAAGRAAAAVEGANARVQQARASWFPSVSTQGSLARYQEPWVVAPLHRFDPTSPPLFDETLLQGHLAFGFTVFEGGARPARVRLAEAGEAASVEGVRETEMELVAQVSSAFLEILSAQELLDASESQVSALESEMRRVSQFLEEGKAARVDLLRVQAALSRAEASRISARTDLAVAEGRLARMTSADVDVIRDAGLVPVRLAPRREVRWETAAAAAHTRSPTLARARNELTGAEAGLRVARAAWYPRLETSGRLTNYGTLSGDHTQEWQASLNLSFPIFTGGARSGAKEEARARVRSASENVRLLEMAVEDGLEQAWAAVAETRALRDALESAVTRSEEVARIEALALEAGAGVQTDFLLAEAELFEARASLAKAKNGETMACVQLARIMGELTLDWLEQNVENER